MSPFEMGATTRVALEHLLEVAQGSDAQARRTADFLLAWWDPDLHGGFALNNLWDMDDDVARACVLVFAWIAANRADPRQVGYGPQFEALFAGTMEWSRYEEWMAGNEAIRQWSSGGLRQYDLIKTSTARNTPGRERVAAAERYGTGSRLVPEFGSGGFDPGMPVSSSK